jgi:hypothetical protein
VLEFNSGGNVEVASSFSVFFTNPYSSYCGPIIECTLHAKGCFANYPYNNLEITSSTGRITAKQNVDEGYYNIVCIRCQNAVGSIVQVDNWTVT